MDFKDLLGMLGRRWKTIVSVVLLCLMVAAALTATATPQYNSSARVFISTDTSSTTDAFYASAFTAARVQSYANLATSQELLNQVVEELDLDMTARELSSKVSARVQEGTVIVIIDVTDTNPRVAQQLAAGVSQQLTGYLEELETPKGRDTAPIKASVIDAASFNDDPVTPRTALNLMGALLIGLLLGTALAVMRDLLDTTLKRPEEIEKATGAPVMAHIAYDPDMDEHPLLTQQDTHTPRAEAFRMLRTNLQFLNLDVHPKAFVITSAVPGEGKTSTSVNLAIACAQSGRRTIIVDCDLRRPKVASVMGLVDSVGVTTTLVGQSTLTDAIQRHAGSAVDVLTSGPLPPNPTEVLQSQVTRELLDELRASYDVVIVDAPPLLPVADAAILAAEVDGALLVIQHAKTTKDQIAHSLNRLEQVGARLFGAVVNMSPSRKRGGRYGYYYDSYGYAPSKSSR